MPRSYLQFNISAVDGSVGVNLFAPLCATSYSYGDTKSWGIFAELG